MKIEIISAIIAMLSACFAWRSIGVAKKQNAISMQVAMIGVLVQKRSTLELIRREMSIVQDWVYNEFAPTPNNLLKDKFTKEEQFCLLTKTVYSQQKASNIIFCYHHYFSEKDIFELKQYIENVAQSKDLSTLNNKIAHGTILNKFNTEIIPNMLEEIENTINLLDQEIRRDSGV